MENTEEKPGLTVHKNKIYRGTSIKEMTDVEFWEEIKEKGWLKLDQYMSNTLGLEKRKWCFYDPDCIEGNCLFIAVAEALLFESYSKPNTNVHVIHTSDGIRDLLCQNLDIDEKFFKELIDHYKMLSIVDDVPWKPDEVTTNEQMKYIIRNPELFSGDEFVLRSLSKILKIDFVLHDIEMMKSYVLGDNNNKRIIKLLYGFADFKLIGEYSDQMIVTVFQS